MKKIFAVFLFICLILFFSFPSHANNNEETKLEDFLKISLDENRDKIIAAFSGKEDMIQDVSYNQLDVIDLENAFRITVSEALLITTYYESNDISSVKSDLVQWKIPLLKDDEPSGIVTLVEKNGDIQMVGISNGGRLLSTMPTYQSIAKSLDSFGITVEQIKDIDYIYSYVYKTLIVSVRCEDENYILPYGNNASDFRQGDVYTEKEFMQLLYNTYDESQIIPNTSGGIPLRVNTPSVNWSPIIATSFCSVGFLALCILYHNKWKAQR